MAASYPDGVKTWTPRTDGVDDVMAADINSIYEEVTALETYAIPKNGDASDVTAAFTQASTRANLTSGEKLKISLGKIMKWFADLKTVAFSGSYSDLTNKPTIPAGKADVGLSNVDNVKQATKVEFDAHLAEDASIDNVHGLREKAISLGNGSISSGRNSIAIGQNAESSVYSDVAIGRNAKATGQYNGAITIGTNSSASNDYAMALGMSTESVNGREGVLGGSVYNSTRRWIVPGDFTVSGTKNFEIPHPKPEKKATHRIRHGAVESPTAGDTLYRFKVQSTKENDLQYIDLPDYFIHLNKDVQIFVSPQGHFGNGYGELNGETEQLEIHCELAGEYNVLVIGTRNDDHQSVQDWNIKGVEREIGESWTGETYVFSVDEIIEVEEIKEEVA